MRSSLSILPEVMSLHTTLPITNDFNYLALVLFYNLLLGSIVCSIANVLPPGAAHKSRTVSPF